ncbi:MAG: DNA repair protein RecN [Anaerolineae bacterium]|nr:DNA repair protein RecN [Anaerolineae bacterium]
MLRELHIEDFAIIDELHLTLEPGLNILTGETGAGKSILIDAVLLILGERADTSAIRLGAERSYVEGMFLLTPALQTALAPLIEREGLEGDAPDTLWLSRELRSTGRTVARVNGRVVSVSLLREIAEPLVDVHGQGEHLSLLRVREHLNLLDRFADLGTLRDDLAAKVRQVQKLRRELTQLFSNERDRMQRIDLLRFQVDEIEKAALKPGEKEALEAELTRLTHAEQLVKLASGIVNRLEEGQDRAPSVVDQIGRSQRDMASLARIDTSLEPQMTLLNEVGYQIEDLANTLRDYIAEIEFNPKRQAWVEERLMVLRHLERKYGGNVEDVLSHAEHAAAELRTLEHSDERIAELQDEEQALLSECAVLALDLSRRRQEAALGLAAAVEAELGDLRMEGAQFGVAFHHEASATGLPLASSRPADLVVTSAGSEIQDDTPVHTASFDATGIDQVEFLVAINVGEGLKSLVRTASGGETSRLMLALKTVLSRVDRTPTLIFDEIDQGIGGRIGAVVGQKLWQLTATSGQSEVTHQVLCVTHLPQLAGFGDVHFKVLKEIVDNRTVTHVQPLTEETRIGELAQMLGTQGSAAERGGYEILQQAEIVKQRVGA